MKHSEINPLLPTFFISHGGGPCFWMDWDPPHMFKNLESFLENIPNLVGTRPKAILVISGHWEQNSFTIQTHPQPPMLYDYYGFPEHTYRLQYPAPGSAELVTRLQNLFQEAKIPFQEDSKRGFDHGLFVPFMKIYPQADIPIVQLSMKNTLDPREHFELGRILAPLRNEGILIVGSGLSYHNLRKIPDTEGISEVFDEWLTQTVCNPDTKIRNENLIRWEKAPKARLAHPREDHLIPLMVVAGAAHSELANQVYSEKMVGWNLKTSSFQFGKSYSGSS